MSTLVAFSPEFVKTLAKTMVECLDGDESKNFYAETLEKIDPGKVVRAILHDAKRARSPLTLESPLMRRYINRIIEKMDGLTFNDLSDIFKEFITTPHQP